MLLLFIFKNASFAGMGFLMTECRNIAAYVFPSCREIAPKMNGIIGCLIRLLSINCGTVLELGSVTRTFVMKNYEYALIIDDDTDLCLLLKVILKDMIPHVKFAHSIESGQRLLSQLKPDVIFLDNNLPDGQGVSRIKEIKSKSPGSLLVIITAAGFSREQSFKEGADLFLEKPFTYSNIFNALNSAKPDQII